MLPEYQTLDWGSKDAHTHPFTWGERMSDQGFESVWASDAYRDGPCGNTEEASEKALEERLTKLKVKRV